MSRRVTIALTIRQAEALCTAAIRGIDEWEAAPEDGGTPDKTIQDRALHAWQALMTKIDEVAK